MNRRLPLALLALAALPPPCQAAPPGMTVLEAKVVARYPHDSGAFTEGLAFGSGGLYESVGLNGRSQLRRVDLTTGRTTRVQPLAAQFFGEGLTVLEGQIYQLTWQNHLGFVYDEASFRQLNTFSYPTEGWGLTTDGTRLIMSDGTDRLSFLDPKSLKVTGSLAVRDRGVPLRRLNELEYVNGLVYANVWFSDWIARIDPVSGQVVGWIDARALANEARAAGASDPNAVLNGIAYNPATRKLYLTGKLWPTLYEVQLLPSKAAPPPPGGDSSLGQ